MESIWCSVDSALNDAEDAKEALPETFYRVFRILFESSFMIDIEAIAKRCRETGAIGAGDEW